MSNFFFETGEIPSLASWKFPLPQIKSKFAINVKRSY